MASYDPDYEEQSCPDCGYGGRGHRVTCPRIAGYRARPRQTTWGAVRQLVTYLLLVAALAVCWLVVLACVLVVWSVLQ